GDGVHSTARRRRVVLPRYRVSVQFALLFASGSDCLGGPIPACWSPCFAWSFPLPLELPVLHWKRYCRCRNFAGCIRVLRRSRNRSVFVLQARSHSFVGRKRS